MNLRKIFTPKPDKFLQLLMTQTELTVKGLLFLRNYMEKRNTELARKVAEVEKEATRCAASSLRN